MFRLRFSQTPPESSGGGVFWTLVAITFALMGRLNAATAPIQLSADQAARWQKILFYAPGMWGVSRSLVDSVDYFLAESHSKYDPQAELEETIAQVLRPLQSGQNPNQHPKCRVKRRVSWLIDEGLIDQAELPQFSCQDYLDWRGSKKFDGISLVFSSSYPNNPSSMFGHTFLRMHRSKAEQKSGLLDDAINFSAYPDTSNTLLYTLKGTAGGFHGFFSFTPYYLKVQEYSNADSRDLWEYRLHFTPKDIENVFNTLWEMGPHAIDYFYFDENCSAIILHFLESVKPTLSLTKFSVWIIPADTVRTAVKNIEIDEPVVYRPSALSRFLHKYRGMSPELRTKVDTFINKNGELSLAHELTGLDPKSEARVLDCLLDYFEFDERIAGSNTVVRYKTIRDETLERRSRLPLVTWEDPAAPARERPDVGHDSARLGLELGTMGESLHREAFLQYHWRPALHDKMSQDAGYAAGLGIDFFDLKIRHRPAKKRLEVSSFYPLRILSLPRLESIIKKPAWNFSVGTDLVYKCNESSGTTMDPCRQTEAKAGAGISQGLFGQRDLLYAMASGIAGHQTFLNGGVYGGLEGDFGLILDPEALNLKTPTCGRQL